MLTVKLAWVSSIGQASNAVVGAGSPQPFRSIKAEWTSALSKICQKKKAFVKKSFLPTNPATIEVRSIFPVINLETQMHLKRGTLFPSQPETIEEREAS